MSRSNRLTDQDINRRRHQLWSRMLQERNMGFVRGMWPKQYKPTDWAHRHRIRDQQPKTEQVSGYTRRI